MEIWIPGQVHLQTCSQKEVHICTICPIQAPAILSFNSVFEIFCAEINKMLVIKTSKKMIGFFILIRVDLLEGTLFYVNLPIVVNNLCFEIILDLHLKYP